MMRLGQGHSAPSREQALLAADGPCHNAPGAISSSARMIMPLACTVLIAGTAWEAGQRAKLAVTKRVSHVAVPAKSMCTRSHCKHLLRAAQPAQTARTAPQPAHAALQLPGSYQAVREAALTGPRRGCRSAGCRARPRA